MHYVVDVSISEVQEAEPAKLDSYGKIVTVSKDRKTRQIAHVVMSESALLNAIEQATVLLGVLAARQSKGSTP